MNSLKTNTKTESKYSYDQVVRELHAMAEPGYRMFSCKLMPNVDPKTVLGVRLPRLRKLAGEIAAADWEKFLGEAKDDTYEEIQLQGMVIGCANADFETILPWIQHYVLKISNWQICDCFCSSLKIAETRPKEMWAFLQPYLADYREYHLRFGVVMMLSYYVDKQHADDALQILGRARCDDFYAGMAVAWAISVYYAAFPHRTLRWLRQTRLSEFVYRKALTKILESDSVPEKDKTPIRDLRDELNEAVAAREKKQAERAEAAAEADAEADAEEKESEE